MSVCISFITFELLAGVSQDLLQPCKNNITEHRESNKATLKKCLLPLFWAQELGEQFLITNSVTTTYQIDHSQIASSLSLKITLCIVSVVCKED